MSRNIPTILFDAYRRAPRKCPSCSTLAPPGGYARAKPATETVFWLLWGVMFVLSFTPGVLLYLGISPEQLTSLSAYFTPVTFSIFVLIIAYAVWKVRGQAVCSRCGAPGLLEPGENGGS